MSVRDLISMLGSGGDTKDPNFKNVSLLLNGDGTNGSQNNTFVDSSSNNFTITRNGNTTQGTFSPYGSLWSNYFTSSGSDYFQAPQSTALQFGTGDFTIEFWFFSSSTSLQCVYDSRSGGNGAYPLVYINNGQPVYYVNSADQITGSAVSLNAWHHLAVSRSGTSTKMFIDGVQTGSTWSDSTNYVLPSYTVIGKDSTKTAYPYTGYISNLRVVKGTALYTTTFTPSTTPLTAVSGTSLLTCQSNRFIDNSSNNFTLTVSGSPSVQRFSPFNPTAPYSAATIGGSGYFYGSGDSVSVPTSTSLQFGTGAYTIEFWFKTTVSTQYASFVSNETGGGFTILINTSAGNGQIAIYNGSASLILSATNKYNDDAWHHLAWCRDSTSARLYIDGALINSNAGQATYNQENGGTWYIGNNATYTPRDYSGYISNFRVVKGTAVYTGSTYAVPTSPVTAITNTSLLCNFTNAGIPDAAMMNDLETVGNAQVSTSVKKYGTGSIAFDGTGDWLVSPSSPTLSMGSGDFTVEGWFYTTAATTGQCIVDFRNPDTANIGFDVFIYGGIAKIAAGTSGALFIQGTTTLSNNTWYHFALTRSGTAMRLFLNGTQESSTYTSTQNFTNSIVKVGAGVNGTFYGYIDDLRITKGLARYTANFVPPAQALPTN